MPVAKCSSSSTTRMRAAFIARLPPASSSRPSRRARGERRPRARRDGLDELAGGSRAMKAARILVVDDEEHLATGIRENLEAEGYRTEIAHDGVAGLERLRAGPAL